jgi:hypothetical protein
MKSQQHSQDGQGDTYTETMPGSGQELAGQERTLVMQNTEAKQSQDKGGNKSTKTKKKKKE